MRNIVITVAVLALTGAGAYAYVAKAPAPHDDEMNETFGSYAYECDEHVKLSITPAADMSFMKIAPVEGGAYPPAVTLMRVGARRYEGGGVVFTARGETVTLGEGDSAINCSPVPNPDEAPFNFGD